ncbi:hypothetical protein CEUSTIGMA_g13912.t1, partial [Chlamydomonas eustigma]
PVIDWLLETWKQLLSPFPDLVQWAIVPRSKTIIIADDPHGWSSAHPPRQLMKNWTRLRVAVIGAIWFTRGQRKVFPIHQLSFASQAIALAASSLTDAIRRDWLRTTQDLRTLDNGFTCADWLRGPAAIQRYSSFKKSWLSPPIFCSVTAEDTSKRLSLHIPAPPFPATVWIDQPLDPTLLPSPALLPRFIIPPRTGQGDQGPTPALLPGLNTAPRTGQAIAVASSPLPRANRCSAFSSLGMTLRTVMSPSVAKSTIIWTRVSYSFGNPAKIDWTSSSSFTSAPDACKSADSC